MAQRPLTEEEKKILFERAKAKFMQEKGLTQEQMDQMLEEAQIQDTPAVQTVAVVETVAEEPKKKEKKQKGLFKKTKKEKKELGEGFGPLDLLANFFTWLIDGHDKLQEKVDDALIAAGISISQEYHNAIDRYRGSRKRIGLSALTITLMCGVMLLVFDQFTVYQYSYNGRVLGYVKNQEAVTEVLDVASDNIKANNKDIDVSFKANDNITFQLVTAKDKPIDTSDEAVNKLAYMTDIEVDAYAIYEEGVLLTIVESERAAKGALDSVKVSRSVPDEGMKLISAKFNKALSIEPVTAMLTSIQSEHEAADLLLKGGELDIWHVVADGETVKSVCKEYGVTVDKILGKDGVSAVSKIGEGDKICIKKTINPLEVKVVEKGTMAEVLPFKAITEETTKMYKGMTLVTQQGVNGKQIITGTVTKVNDTIVKRRLKSKELISAPVDEITQVGTADIPTTKATGSYMIPIYNYLITDRFGPRWGTMHTGIDFASSTGTPIYAADGGVVTRSEWYSGYGYCIDVDHENGESTRYAHCSKLLVNTGDRVYKGQNIALVGSTGNSTGPHLHFEILISGKAIDPGPTLGLY